MSDVAHSVPATVAATPQIQLTPFTLNDVTKALLKTLSSFHGKPKLDDSQQIIVSQTVSFFAFAYEKFRSAMDYHEDHLSTRYAIERILRRRLSLNPSGSGEAENLIRELMWARYFANGTLGTYDVHNIQETIKKWLELKKIAEFHKESKTKELIHDYVADMLTAEIEEILNPAPAFKSTAFAFYTFQELKEKIKIEGVSDDMKDAYLYSAVEEGFIKNDRSYTRYHIWRLWNKELYKTSEEEFKSIIENFVITIKKIEHIFANVYKQKLIKYVNKQSPPFKIIQEMYNKKSLSSPDKEYYKEDILENIKSIIKEKYAITQTKLRNRGISSLVYIFLTKMIFALILEGPLTQMMYGSVEWLPIIVNSLFPVFLMGFILLLVVPPGKNNTAILVDKVTYLLNTHNTSSQPTILKTQNGIKNPLLEGIFWGIYIAGFFLSFYYIINTLLFFDFHIISVVVFLFFACVVSYFAFKTTQIADEYKVESGGTFFGSIIDFIFLPFLRLGKFLGSQLSKLNVLVYVLDFIIEAPFKMLFNIVEEWTRYIKVKKEEIL